MLNFRQWFESFVDHEPTIKDALNVFFKPNDTVYISAASIIDAELTKSHVPFIYLSDTDDIYEGFGNDYHGHIIDSQTNHHLGLKLNSAYSKIGEIKTSRDAVGRIGYRIDFDRLKKYLARENLMLLLQGEETGDEIEKSNRMRNFNLKIDSRTPIELQRLFSSIDIIAIYSSCTIKIAARAVELLEEKDSINDLNKTIVIFDEKPYLASEFITHAQKQEPEELSKPINSPDPTTLSKEKSTIYGSNFKPTNWKQAFRQLSMYPNVGDSVLNKGKRYNG